MQCTLTSFLIESNKKYCGKLKGAWTCSRLIENNDMRANCWGTNTYILHEVKNYILLFLFSQTILLWSTYCTGLNKSLLQGLIHIWHLADNIITLCYLPKNSCVIVHHDMWPLHTCRFQFIASVFKIQCINYNNSILIFYIAGYCPNRHIKHSHINF